MSITFEFACKDDCLDQMVPSDLRKLVKERDAALAECERLRELLICASKAESRPEFMQIIDTALSAKL